MLKPIKSRFCSVLAVVLLLGVAPAHAAPASNASAVVEQFHVTLLNVMKNADKLGFAGRYKQLSPAIQQAFDHPFMVRNIVSVALWKRLSGEQQEQLLDAFRKFSIAEYASRFDGWSGQALKVVGEAEGRRGSVLVSTVIGRGDDDDVTLRYVMRQDDAGKWRIVDVLYLGTTSEIARRRAEYQSVIRRDGVDALVNALRKQFDQLASSEQARVAQKSFGNVPQGRQFD